MGFELEATGFSLLSSAVKCVGAVVEQFVVDYIASHLLDLVPRLLGFCAVFWVS